MHEIDLPPYKPPAWLRGGHLQTILPTLFRQLPESAVRRERLELADGDFLDLDWHDATLSGAARPRGVAILAHGLEGSASRVYMRGTARALVSDGWTVCAMNHRGCSGEPNRLLRAYHSGATEDLDAVVERVLQDDPPRIALIGFSLGGNIILKWLGDQGDSTPKAVRAAACFSVPVDLASSSRVMEGLTRRVYMRRFLRTLTAKVTEKALRFPDALSAQGLSQMRTFAEFDDRFTAPVHGFSDAEDYWRKASSLPVLGQIRVRTLLVQALDDPFLSPSCYPTAVAAGNPSLRLLTPRHGGHVGFMAPGGRYWSEEVAVRFLGAGAVSECPI